jgi:hypothetical protein
MLPTPRFTKDPSATLDSTLDWTAWLQSAATADTIASAVWTVPNGITSTSQIKSLTTTTIWLTGGAVGSGKQIYKIQCVVTTANGRSESQSLELLIQSK